MQDRSPRVPEVPERQGRSPTEDKQREVVQPAGSRLSRPWGACMSHTPPPPLEDDGCCLGHGGPLQWEPFKKLSDRWTLCQASSSTGHSQAVTGAVGRLLGRRTSQWHLASVLPCIYVSPSRWKVRKSEGGGGCGCKSKPFEQH